MPVPELLLVHVADGWAARNFDQLNLRESEEMQADRAYLARIRDGLQARGKTLDTVTPSLNDKGEVEGYFSVRRKPSASGVKVIEGLYKAMLAEEQRVGSKEACQASLALLQTTLAERGVDYDSFILSI